jgi:hypothetical protein
MMDSKLNDLEKKLRLSWALVIVGVVMFVLGELLRAAFPGVAVNFKLLSAIGILAFGLGAGNVVRGLTVRGDPQAARRLVIAENDERTRTIQQRAGNAAFLVSFLLNALVLIVYSSITVVGRSDFDLLWWVLAAMVLVPSIFYVVLLVRLENQ